MIAKYYNYERLKPLKQSVIDTVFYQNYANYLLMEKVSVRTEEKIRK